MTLAELLPEISKLFAIQIRIVGAEDIVGAVPAVIALVGSVLEALLDAVVLVIARPVTLTRVVATAAPTFPPKLTKKFFAS